MLQALRGRLYRHRLELGFSLALLTLLAFTTWLFLPGTQGPFILDDFSNLSPLGEYGGVANFDTFRHFVFGNISGPTGRPVSMLSFLLDAQDWPAPAEQFKYTNVMIHLLCGLAFCWLAYLLSERMGLSPKGRVWVSLIVAMLWLVHPLNVSTTLYVIQRMAQLMTLFAGLSLVFYMLGRRAMEKHQLKANLYLILSLFPFGLLSVLSKENGALLLLLIVLIESLFFRSHIRSKFFTLWYRAGVLLPLFIVLAYLAWSVPGFLENYRFRDFSPLERLLSETRILATYIWKIFLPDQYLGSVFHDGYLVSTGLFTPFSTFLSTLFLFALLALAIYWRKSQAVFSFGVLWFFAMHLTESTIVPLELYFEHRNYMAMFGPVFAIGWYVHKILVSGIDKSAKVVVSAFVAGNFLLSSWLTYSVIAVWGDDGRFYSYMSKQWPRSVRARLVYSEYLEMEERYDEALQQLYIMREYYPQEAAVLLQLWNFACRYNLQQPLSMEEIASLPDLRLTIGNLNFQLDKLDDALRSGYCRPPERESLFKLYERIASFTMRPGRSAQFRYNYSNLHLILGDPVAAIEQLDLAIQHRPSVTYKLRQAVIAGLMQDYDLSLEFAQQARELDAERSPLVPSREAEIVQVETAIRNQIEN
jgi:hypothetical protein